MQVNVKDLLKLENMDIFAQYSGICWMVTSFAIMFFDDNNKIATLNLFEWTERNGKIIPVISKYKQTKNSQQDLLMYLMLEILRVNLKKAIMGTYDTDMAMKCDTRLTTLIRDFYYSLGYGVKSNKDQHGGSLENFIKFFCKYHDLQVSFNLIDISKPLSRFSYFISQKTSSADHASAIVTVNDKFYYFDGNLVKRENYKLIECSKPKKNFKDVILSCNYNYVRHLKSINSSFKYTHESGIMYLQDKATKDDIKTFLCAKNLLKFTNMLDNFECLINNNIDLTRDLFAAFPKFLTLDFISSDAKINYIYDFYLDICYRFYKEFFSNEPIIKLYDKKFRYITKAYIRDTRDLEIMTKEELGEIFEEIYKHRPDEIFKDMDFLNEFLTDPEINKIFWLSLINILRYFSIHTKEFKINTEVRDFIISNYLKFATLFIPKIKKYIPNLSIDNLVENSTVKSVIIFSSASNKITLIDSCTEEEEMEKSLEIIRILGGTTHRLSLIYGGSVYTLDKYKKYKTKYLNLKNKI
jgi:hypothetical protein